MNKPGVFLLFVCASSSWAQLSSDQKIQDFQSLSALFAKQYAPYGWKKQLLGVDLFNTGPWADRIRKSKDDLEFYEIMEQYVASLNDVHSEYLTPSNFLADLRFRVDIYDGRFLIDSIDRTALPTKQFPFTSGDELMMVEGLAPDDYVSRITPLNSFGNPLSTRRYMTTFVTVRDQAIIPRSEEVGATATVVVRRQNGNLETYTVPWVKSGTPITQNGPVPTPQSASRGSAAALLADSGSNDAQRYLHPLRYLQTNLAPAGKSKFVRNIGGLNPIFSMPAGFTQRLGRRTSDFFFSGTYKSGGKTIGFIRISDFEPVADFSALDVPESQFDSEIAFMEKNADGLVIDVMRNPGGFGCYAEDLMSRLATQPFHGLALEFRPTIGDVQSFAQSVQDATDGGAEDWQINLLKAYQAEVVEAYNENRGMTGQLPVCTLSLNRDPNTNGNGKLAIYDKPILLLTDEFTISAGDFFSAMFQDAQRGMNFGMRTSGAGGSIFAYPIVGFYSEGTASVTQTLGVRKNPVVTPDYPTAPLIENIGIRPEIVNDYMTKENLLQNGKPFTDAFTTAILGMIQ